MADKKIVFVSGVARSGTSALVNLMNAHPKVLIGQERFYWRYDDKTIALNFFEKDRFVRVCDGDTHNSGGVPGNVSDRFDVAEVIGDKYPNLFEKFQLIFERFPDALHVYIVRNPLSVVESYDSRHRDVNDSWGRSFEQGMAEWNRSVQTLVNLPSAQRERFLVVEYESVFNDKKNSDKIFEFLGLEPPYEQSLINIRKKFADLSEKTVPRRDEIRRFVALNADWDSYKKLIISNKY